MSSNDKIIALQKAWSDTSLRASNSDYILLTDLGVVYAGISGAGQAAVVIPLKQTDIPTVGRRASGCELFGYSSLEFSFQGKSWRGPAATLVCNSEELLDVFAVLAADLARRVGSEPTWNSILGIVEEWQTLLTPRGTLSPEQELGLWGELWFIDQSNDVTRLIEAWRGPEGDSVDFFMSGKSTEIKTSRVRRQHHVSQSQVETPVGQHEAWFLSVWVKVDPSASLTVPKLVERILKRAGDRAGALKKLAQAGFSPSDKGNFTAGFLVMSEPEWYPADSVPRVRSFDSGVTDLRYRINLDGTCRAEAKDATQLWRHFLERAYGEKER